MDDYITAYGDHKSSASHQDTQHSVLLEYCFAVHEFIISYFVMKVKHV